MSKPPEGLSAYIEIVAGEFRTAAGHAGLVEQDLLVAGERVRLRVAGRVLAEALLPALEPRLSAPSGIPDAEIQMYEASALGGVPAPVPWRDHELGARGLLRSAENPAHYAVHEVGGGTLSLVDRSLRRVIYRVPDAGSLPWWERAAPLRPALLAALGGRHQTLVHAGAVGNAGEGVLLAGPGGAGKTTLALAALQAGMRYVADDYLLLKDGEDLEAWNLFATAKLDAGHLARFPSLAGGLTRRPGTEKIVLDVSRRAPSQLAPSLRLRAVIVPRVQPGTAALTPISKVQAMLALAPSTVFQMPYDDGAAVELLSRVARELPCFSLKLGDDPSALPALISEALSAEAQASARLVGTRS